MKKMILIGMCLIMVVALVGCGAKNTGNGSPVAGGVDMPNSSEAVGAEKTQVAITETDDDTVLSGLPDEEVGWDMPPMVRVNGIIYLDTGKKSTIDGRCGTMDGVITSSVAQTEMPTEDNQSNFGTGYGYQYGSQNNTIEIYMNDDWWVFEPEENYCMTALGG